MCSIVDQHKSMKKYGTLLFQYIAKFSITIAIPASEFSLFFKPKQFLLFQTYFKGIPMSLFLAKVQSIRAL